MSNPIESPESLRDIWAAIALLADAVKKSEPKDFKLISRNNTLQDLENLISRNK